MLGQLQISQLKTMKTLLENKATSDSEDLLSHLKISCSLTSKTQSPEDYQKNIDEYEFLENSPKISKFEKNEK